MTPTHAAGGRSNHPAKRIHVVEYLRGVAALAVAWFHMTNTYGPGFVASLGSLGWLGVDVFFVISGFVIPYSLWARYSDGYSLSRFPEFMMRRIVRLEPPYLISILLVAALWELSAITPGYQGGDPAYSTSQVLAHIAYMPRVLGYDWLQPVYWTLAFEFVFYMTVGLTFALLHKHGIPIVIGITMAGLALLWALYGQFEPRLLLFTMGVTVFMTVTRSVTPLIGCIVIGSSFIAMTLGGYPYNAVAGLAASGIIVGAQRIKLSGGAGRALMFLGTISYSLYIVHVPVGGRVVNLGKRFIDGSAQELALSLVALSVSIAAAYIFYLTVERRFVHASKAIGQRMARARGRA